MASLTLALALVCAIAFTRDSTRSLGLLALALLVILFPRFFLALLLIAGGVYLFNLARRFR